MRRVHPFLGFATLASFCWAGAARAQDDPHGELLWERALVLEARGDAEARTAFEAACEAASAEACQRLASEAVATSDFEGAEEWLQLAHEADPDDPEIRLALALVIARLGNCAFAMQELAALERAGRDVDFELGYCLHETGQHEQAAERLTRVAPRSGLAALYAASSLEGLGRDEEAVAEARLAAGRVDEPEVAAAGRELETALRRRIAAEDRTAISVWGTVAGGYDSNPTLGPDEAPSGAPGPRLRFEGGLLTEPLGGAAWTVGGRVSLSRDQSFFDEARAFDFTAVQGRAHARFVFGDDRAHELQVAYQYSIGLLDGGQGVEEDALYVFTESHLGVLGYGLDLTESVTLRLRATAGWSAYHNLARSGAPLRGGLGVSSILLDGRLKLYAEVGVAAAWTRSPRYDRVGPTALVAAAWLTPLWDLELVASWTLSWSHYLHSTGVEFAFDYARPDVRRSDVVDSLSVEVGRSFLDDHLRVAVRYHLTDSWSTIETYDYQRHVVDLAITGGM